MVGAGTTLVDMGGRELESAVVGVLELEPGRADPVEGRADPVDDGVDDRGVIVPSVGWPAVADGVDGPESPADGPEPPADGRWSAHAAVIRVAPSNNPPIPVHRPCI